MLLLLKGVQKIRSTAKILMEKRVTFVAPTLKNVSPMPVRKASLAQTAELMYDYQNEGLNAQGVIFADDIKLRIQMNEGKKSSLKYLKSNSQQLTQTIERSEEVVKENVSSLANSIHLFWRQHQAQSDEIERNSEDLQFLYSQLQKQSQINEEKKNKLYNSMMSLGDIQQFLSTEIETSSFLETEIEKRKSQICEYKTNISLISNEISSKESSLLNLRLASLKNKKDLDCLKNEKKCLCYLKLRQNLKFVKNEIEIKQEKINTKKYRIKKISKIIKFFMINPEVVKIKESLNRIRINLLESQTKRDSLLVEEQRYIQNLKDFQKKEKLLKEEEFLIKKTIGKLSRKLETANLTVDIQKKAQKPLLVLLNEINDLIQKALQKEAILYQTEIKTKNLNYGNDDKDFKVLMKQNEFMKENKLNFLNEIDFSEHIDGYNEVAFLLQEEIKENHNFLLELRVLIEKEMTKKATLYNEMKLIKLKTKSILNDSLKMGANHNGNVSILFDFVSKKSGAKGIEFLQKRINEKKEFLKKKKSLYYNRYDAIVNLIQNYRIMCEVPKPALSLS